MFFRGQIIGKYRILATLGSGGFGTVYRAENTWINKVVALKVPHKQGVDSGELLREQFFFIVMDFVPGEPLEAIIARDGALDRPRPLDYPCQICTAVAPPHRH